MSPDIVLQWDWLNDQLRHTLHSLYYTPMGAFIRSAPWIRPAFDFLQVSAVALVLGAVCVLDLRLVGFPRSVPPGALRGMIPLAESGVILTVVSGVFLLCESPDIYLFNAEARWKVIFVVIASANLLLFRTPFFESLDTTTAHHPALVRRVLAAAALTACLATLWAARLAA